MRIIIEELKAIQATHENAIIHYKNRLKIKAHVSIVVSAIREKKTNSLRGAHMSSFIDAINTGSLFQNKIAF
jgi:hypothetical protein